MLVAAFGALLASVGVGIAIGAPLIGIHLQREAQLKREHAEALATATRRDQITDEAYRVLATEQVALAN